MLFILAFTRNFGGTLCLFISYSCHCVKLNTPILERDVLLDCRRKPAKIQTHLQLCSGGVCGLKECCEQNISSSKIGQL